MKKWENRPLPATGDQPIFDETRGKILRGGQQNKNHEKVESCFQRFE
jgi:hypothetical protein